jgi:gamma-glutamyl hydrolase
MKLQHLDGVLYPGGGGDYWDMGEFIFEQVKKFNDEGHFYPAWGTCLGFQHLGMFSATAGKKALSVIQAH